MVVIGVEMICGYSQEGLLELLVWPKNVVLQNCPMPPWKVFSCNLNVELLDWTECLRYVKW